MEKQGSCIQEVLVGHLVKKLMVKGLQGAGMTRMVPNHAVQIIWLWCNPKSSLKLASGFNSSFNYKRLFGSSATFADTNLHQSDHQ